MLTYVICLYTSTTTTMYFFLSASLFLFSNSHSISLSFLLSIVCHFISFPSLSTGRHNGYSIVMKEADGARSRTPSQLYNNCRVLCFRVNENDSSQQSCSYCLRGKNRKEGTHVLVCLFQQKDLLSFSLA